MAEDRMLNDEILLGLIKANSGGGGGGTTNYNLLENKPQIAGTELQGNKSLADLDIASASALATKQNATDNNLDTDAKTIVGAINEHEGDIDSLKSGLTTLENEVNGDATVYPYADVITINDAVSANLADCSVKVEPVQDLHGQSKPYVGGAGKNKLPLVLADIKTANVTGTWADNVYTINGGTVTVNTDSDGNVISIKVNGTFSATTSFILWAKTGYPYPFENTSYTLNGCSGGSGNTFKQDVFYRKSGVDTILLTAANGDASADFSVLNDETVSVAAVRIVIYVGTLTNQMFYPMIRLATETDATFAPYTNICPISGHTEAVITRSDRHDTYTALNTQVAGCNVIITEDGHVTIKGKTTSTFDKYISNGMVGDGVTSYKVINVPSLSSDLEYYVYDTTSSTRLVTFKTSETSAFVIPSGHIAKFGLIAIKAFNVDIDLDMRPIIATANSINRYTLALGDTIYGGTVDFDSGVMTVDRAIIDLGTLTWNFDSSVEHSLYYATLTGLKSASTVKSDSFKSGSYSEVYYHFVDNAIASHSQYGGQLRVYSTYYEGLNYDGSAFKTAMDGHYACYELATPFTVQLTPQQIQLLQGTNTLTASTGDISVTVNGVSGAIGAVQEQVNGLAEDVAGIKPMDYSTDEQDTGLKWVDGKKIYRKTFASSGGTYTSPISIAHGISNMETVVDKNGSLYYGSTYHAISIDHAEPGNSVAYSIINAGNIVLSYGSDYSGVNAISKYDVTLYYTKTT